MAQAMVTKKVYDAPAKNILIAPEVAVEIGVRLGNTGVSNDSNGRKVIKAGTPIGGTVDAKETRNALLQVTNTSSLGANTQGVAMYDYDVTDGEVTASMVIFGFVDSSKCPTIQAEAKTALAGKITFINGGKEL